MTAPTPQSPEEQAAADLARRLAVLARAAHDGRLNRVSIHPREDD